MTMVTGKQPREPRRERKKAEARQRIISVAMELFGRHGLEGVTVDRIADVADLGKGTIYNYFPAKENIIVAFMVELEARVQAKVSALISSTGSLESILAEFVRYQFQLKKPYHRFVRVLLGQMFMRTPDFMPYMVEMQKVIDPNLEQLFRSLQGRGLLRKDISISDLIEVFKTMHLGLTGLWAVEGPPFRETEKVLRREIHVFCKGLEKKP